MTGNMVKRCLVAGLLVVGTCRMLAQDVGLACTTEWQAGGRGGAQWVNLLRADGSLTLAGQWRLDVAAISVSRTSNERLADDWQTFSNIEEENLPLALAVLGLGWNIGKSEWFFGVRTVNEDYFTSACMSLFTNSSCGIFPTLSTNWPIANYPMASVGIDYKCRLGHWLLETSLYNGTGYNRFGGSESAFRFCPRTDGVFSITSINYQNHGSDYNMGFALHSGVPAADEAGSEGQASEAEADRLTTAVWGYAEQRLSAHLHALLQYSVATVRSGCRQYAGAGLVMEMVKSRGGIFFDYAQFSFGSEVACEVTWQFPFLKQGYIQPALHLISNSQCKAVVGLLRLGYRVYW